MSMVPNRNEVAIVYDHVWKSPEFMAFCARFGIAWGLRTKKMVITLEVEGAMTVEQTYQATLEEPK